MKYILALLTIGLFSGCTQPDIPMSGKADTDILSNNDVTAFGFKDLAMFRIEVHNGDTYNVSNTDGTQKILLPSKKGN